MGKLSKEGKAFYDAMVDVTSGNGVANITLVNNDSNVNIGRYDNGFVDMGDISQFNAWGSYPTGAMQQGKLIHETVEQYTKAKLGYSNDGKTVGYDFSHRRGVDAENSVNGNISSTEQYRPGVYIVNYKERNGSVTTVSYTTSRRRMTVNQVNKK